MHLKTRWCCFSVSSMFGNRKLVLSFLLNAGHVAVEKCFNRSQNFLYCIAMDLVDEIIWKTFERRILPETNGAKSSLLYLVSGTHSAHQSYWVPAELFLFSVTGADFRPEPKVLRNESQMGPSQEKSQGEQYNTDYFVIACGFRNWLKDLLSYVNQKKLSLI